MKRKLCRIFIMMFICYGIGSFIVCVDLFSVPVMNLEYARSHPEWRVTDVTYPVSTFDFCLGDGLVTALENILIWIPLMFGFMRTVDFIRACHDEEKEDAWTDFIALSGL